MTDINALQDKQEITDLCYRYGLTLDSRDWAGLASVFTPDANAFYLDMPPCHGYQAIEDTCRMALEPMSACAMPGTTPSTRFVSRQTHGCSVRPCSPDRN